MDKIFDLIKENNLEELANIYELNIEKFQKKRIIQTIVIALPLSIFSIINLSIIYFALTLGCCYFIYKLNYWEYNDKLKKANIELESNFPVWIRLLLAYLKNGQNNLYKSIESSAKYFDKSTQQILIQFANQINIDHTEKPYLDFAKKFKNIQLANTILLSLYYYNNSTSNQVIIEQLVAQNNVLLQNEIENVVEVKSKKLFSQGSLAFILAMIYILVFVLTVFILELSTISKILG